MKKYLTIVFFTSAINMGVELLASRILAPYFGTTLNIWAILIGVILLSGSFGSYLGGKLSTKGTTRNTLFFLLLFAIIATLASYLLSTPLLALTYYVKKKEVFATLCTMLLFAPISVLCCSFSPIIIAEKAKSDKVGTSAGDVYALSTIGAIFGTLFTAFVLIPYLSIRTNMLFFAISLFVLMISLFPLNKLSEKSLKKVCLVFILFSLVLCDPFCKVQGKNIVEDVNTLYGRYYIVQDKDITKMAVNGAIESAKRDNSTELLAEYTKYYDLAFLFNNNIKNELCIGGAGYVYPTYFCNKYPNKTMDVVEIDDEMERLAKQYFELKDMPNMNLYFTDGRSYLANNKKKYDAILGDAFKASTPPFELMTEEATILIKNSLNEKGIYIVNIISDKKGNGFFEQYYNTLSNVFKNVNVYSMKENTSNGKQNIILIASDSELKPMSNDKHLLDLVKTKFEPVIKTDKYFTDDYAPIEFLTR